MIREQTFAIKVGLCFIRGAENAFHSDGVIPDISKATEQEWNDLEVMGLAIIHELRENGIHIVYG